LLKIKVEMNI